MEVALDRSVKVRLSEEYLRSLAKRLRWSFEELAASLDCRKAEEGVYECYIAVKRGDEVVVNPYTLGLALKLRDTMYRLT